MKIALYIEDGYEQIILTPQTEAETAILKTLGNDASRVMSIRHGSFYACQGGWTRQGEDKNSTMICMDRRPVP